jgi:hypothetical protein
MLISVKVHPYRELLAGSFKGVVVTILFLLSSSYRLQLAFAQGVGARSTAAQAA